MSHSSGIDTSESGKRQQNSRYRTIIEYRRPYSLGYGALKDDPAIHRLAELLYDSYTEPPVSLVPPMGAVSAIVPELLRSLEKCHTAKE